MSPRSRVPCIPYKGSKSSIALRIVDKIREIVPAASELESLA